jgi:acetyl esterase/lipase
MTTPATETAASNVDLDAAEQRRFASEEATARLRGDFAHELNIAFGPHPRQVFDCYLPATTPKGPVMVFLHGGGFRLGAPGPVAYYGRPILDHGGIFISLGYRLAPEVRFPDTAEDVELGLAGIAGHLSTHGVGTDQLYLSGHSAGAALAAFCALRPRTDEESALKGLVLVSGQYDYARHTEEVGNHESSRYVSDLTAAIEHVPRHTIVIAGDHDLPAVMPAANAIIDAVSAQGGSVEFFTEVDADHFEAIRGFAAADDPVSRAVLSMMALDN